MVGQPTKFFTSAAWYTLVAPAHGASSEAPPEAQVPVPTAARFPTSHCTLDCLLVQPISHPLGCLDTALVACPASGSRPSLLPGLPMLAPAPHCCCCCSMLRAPAASPLRGTTMPALAPLAPTRSRLGFPPLNWRW